MIRIWAAPLTTPLVAAIVPLNDVPVIVPIVVSEPLMETEPVNEWVSSDVSPNLVEPLWNNTDEEITYILNCLALTCPKTVKSEVTNCEPLIIVIPWFTVNVSFTCSDSNEPVPVILNSEPDTLPNTSKSPLPIISFVVL